MDQDDAEFLEQDETVLDLEFLDKILRPKGKEPSRTAPSPPGGSSKADKEAIEQLQGELRRLKQLNQGDTDYLMAKN